MSRLDIDILLSFHDEEWHPSAWFPTVSRGAVNLTDEFPDEQIHRAIIRLAQRGMLQIGLFEDDVFIPLRDVTPAVLLDIQENADSEYHLRTEPNAYEVAHTQGRSRWYEIRNTE